MASASDQFKQSGKWQSLSTRSNEEGGCALLLIAGHEHGSRSTDPPPCRDSCKRSLCIECSLQYRQASIPPPIHSGPPAKSSSTPLMRHFHDMVSVTTRRLEGGIKWVNGWWVSRGQAAPARQPQPLSGASNGRRGRPADATTCAASVPAAPARPAIYHQAAGQSRPLRCRRLVTRGRRHLIEA
eukprot:284157-Chlamydomonas_euryale.AAC.2